MTPVYPAHDRTAWILAQRPPRPAQPDPEKPHGVFLEDERLASGTIVPSGVILLTNRECPWRCLMCDLWKDMPTETVPAGAIPRQIEQALRTWETSGVRPRQIKLYNSGSFFDPAAIPPADYAAIARQVAFAENVIVESHPRLIGERTRHFRDLRAAPLEVAVGLETAHPDVLERLNKKFDLAEFARAAEFLRQEQIALRVFLLVHPPFLAGPTAREWLVKSAAYAFACGASAISLIPTRAGNGAMERLLESGEFVPPTLAAVEDAVSAALGLAGGRVFADLWGLEAFSACPRCLPARRERLERINLSQQDEPRISCPECAGT
jgi:hypothetical protein